MDLSWQIDVMKPIWQGIRSMTRFCSKIGWKWKWSEKCRKSEISLIWCISTTNNVKSCKKFNETAETANFTDFPLSSCEYRPKWTKTMQTQTRRVRLQNFLRGIQICHMKADVLAIPKMWWFLILHFLTQVIAAQSRVKSHELFWQNCGVQKKRHGYNFQFQASIWIEHGSHMVIFRSYSYQKSKLKIVAVSFFLNTA